jgi:hypothetical protein
MNVFTLESNVLAEGRYKADEVDVPFKEALKYQQIELKKAHGQLTSPPA